MKLKIEIKAGDTNSQFEFQEADKELKIYI